MNIYKLDNLELSDRNGIYGGNSGTKEGVLIDSEYWLIKYPKKANGLQDVNNMSYTSSPESEYIGSHVYEILGYPVHDTILGIRDNHIVVACKDLCKENQSLVEFRQLKNTYNKTLNEQLERNMTSTGSSHFVSLEEVITHLKYNPKLYEVDGLVDRFWDCIVIDGFINNNDRNNGNWGVIRTKGQKDILAPIYDNGASFSPNVSEEKILHKINNEKVLIQSACSNITVYSLDEETNALYRDILNLDIPELQNAIKRNVPKIRQNLEKIKNMIDDIPETVLQYKIISKTRKEVYKKELEIRLEHLLQPTYNRIIESEKNISKSQENKSSRKKRDSGWEY